MTKTIELDRLVDYRTEYSAVIKKCHVSGDRLTGLCPFHDDQNSSFSVDLKTGQWYCFAEDSGGNFVTFWAKLHGVDSKQAYREILEKYHVDDEGGKAQKSAEKFTSYSLEEYSQEKHLPVDFLTQMCRSSTERERNGITYLKLPYYDMQGNEVTYRKRFGNKAFRWRYRSSGKISLYGEWQLNAIREAGWVILVEGESDAQTLWYLGFPALGVAGASMFRAEYATLLDGLKLYLHKEPDQGGETFATKVKYVLKEQAFSGELYLWSCKSLGAKDPSALYISQGKDDAKAKIQDLLGQSEKVDWSQEEPSCAIPDEPIHLRQPNGWKISERGIEEINLETMELVCICRTPVLLTKRVKNLYTGIEKIELAFKRDGKWHTAIYPRSTIFSSRNITGLADLGCTVTSENARSLVRFLSALEAENLDRIPIQEAVSTFGWQPGNRFLPGFGEHLTLDLDPSQQILADAFHTNGTLEDWIQCMAPHRSRAKFRFILAAGFAAPLLKILKQRIFFVYNWGDSKGGKTAALKAALSAWGDPERLMVNFNATQVGLERTATFYCDLPLGIDERQLAGNRQEDLAKIVYMISSGKGKTRGTKNGGLQPLNQWRTVALATGEEPLGNDTTQTGVTTRTVEIYGSPFDCERDAGQMHQQVTLNYGQAGLAFMKAIRETDPSLIIDAYQYAEDYLKEVSGGKNMAHISSIAVVAVADTLIDRILFEGEDSAKKARKMAREIYLAQAANDTADVNERAAHFVADWIFSNKAFFGKVEKGVSLGFFDKMDKTFYVLKSLLTKAITNGGYSDRKTYRYMAEHGLIASTMQRDGTKVYAVKKRNPYSNAHESAWYVAFYPAQYDKFCGEEGLTVLPSPDEDCPF